MRDDAAQHDTNCISYQPYHYQPRLYYIMVSIDHDISSQELTEAWSGLRHVAKMCFGGTDKDKNCFTISSPIPRFEPVIKTDPG